MPSKYRKERVGRFVLNNAFCNRKPVELFQEVWHDPDVWGVVFYGRSVGQHGFLGCFLFLFFCGFCGVFFFGGGGSALGSFDFDVCFCFCFYGRSVESIGLCVCFSAVGSSAMETPRDECSVL